MRRTEALAQGPTVLLCSRGREFNPELKTSQKLELPAYFNGPTQR